MTIDFDRASLLLDVYHKSLSVPEAKDLHQAARLELAAMTKPPAPAPATSAFAPVRTTPNG
jgi:hypothetical protein